MESIGDLECEVLKVWCCGTEECEFGGTQLTAILAVRARRPWDRQMGRFHSGYEDKFDQGGIALVSLCSCLSLLRRGGNCWVEVKV
jgi:hypothetical protein